MRGLREGRGMTTCAKSGARISDGQPVAVSRTPSRASVPANVNSEQTAHEAHVSRRRGYGGSGPRRAGKGSPAREARRARGLKGAPCVELDDYSDAALVTDDVESQVELAQPTHLWQARREDCGGGGCEGSTTGESSGAEQALPVCVEIGERRSAAAAQSRGSLAR